MKKRKKIIKDKKLRGEWAESVFMERATEHGLPVSKPWGEMSPYDFVIGKTGRFASVQVKSTVYEADGGYACTVRSGHRRYPAGSFNFLAVFLVVEDVWYILPALEVQGKKTITLFPKSPKAKYEKYREAWHLLRQAAGGSEEVVEQGTEAMEDLAPEDSPLTQSLNGAPGSEVTPVSGVAAKRMENAFSFFRRQLEGGPFAPKKAGES